MDKFKQLETFVAVATKGSLTAAAALEGIAPAVVGRRMDALEARLGVLLMRRTTRKLTLTPEGQAFLEDAQRLLAEWAAAEGAVSAGSVQAKGHLRVTAPAGFGRRHVAPLVPGFLAEHPGLSLSLNLSDRVIDLVNEGFDCAVRVGDLPDSSLVSQRLADNRRLVVATPEYLKRAGTPQHPSDLARHHCLMLSSEASQTRGWAFQVDGKVVHHRRSDRSGGRLDCTDGQVLHDWCLQGLGLAWRSTWEVAGDLQSGRLVSVLDAFAAPPNGVYAVYAQRAHQPLRVRLWIEHLKRHYARSEYWMRVGG
ncbi:LysR family transcriptional regulator [Inhella crocodyli]|uniref:LysR family transcriptional regulator n=1 Tax=Inhella crocodyli TaxID=2499851 RepID=A0A437LHC1_9BURK|nr:LysR family transcriptional regulator [Inhella crocodyli]RVT84795.1 LysR family transcriptional regulator [Inhella crocodyli]